MWEGALHCKGMSIPNSVTGGKVNPGWDTWDQKTVSEGELEGYC